MNLGFLGLGQMGTAMTRRLLSRGYTVAVWDRTPSKAMELAETTGARFASSPADAAIGADAVISMLADDRAVLWAALGEGEGDVDPLVDGMPPSAVHISMSTISPATSRRLAQVHGEQGQAYLAAPVLGRPEAAERGELVVLAAGPRQALESCEGILGALGRKTFALGKEPERANVVKLASNFVMAAMIEVFGEAYALVEGHGIEATTLLGVLQDSMLRPEVLGGYGKRIADAAFEPAGFRLKLGLKDIDLVLEAGEAAALAMPFGSALRDRFVEAVASGLEDLDWSVVGRTMMHRRAA